MRQQINGRRRQNRGSNRRNYSNGNGYSNLNKNTVLDSSGPDGRQRGSVLQLNEKYISLASDAAASDDRILAESYLQFADHYYRLCKEIEISIEAKEAKFKQEKNIIDTFPGSDDEDSEKKEKKLSRRKRGFQIREKELLNNEHKSENFASKEIETSEDVSRNVESKTN